MFREGSNFANPFCPIHRRSSTSREDLHLNYEKGSALFTPPIIGEICAASLFNDNIKDFEEIIAKEVCELLNYNEENEDNWFFLHERVLREICEDANDSFL